MRSVFKFNVSKQEKGIVEDLERMRGNQRFLEIIQIKKVTNVGGKLHWLTAM